MDREGHEHRDDYRVDSDHSGGVNCNYDLGREYPIGGLSTEKNAGLARRYEQLREVERLRGDEAALSVGFEQATVVSETEPRTCRDA